MPQSTTSSSAFDDENAPPDAPAAPAAQANFDALDSLLDEIDDTIQTNASQFVRSFVQKGGQ